MKSEDEDYSVYVGIDRSDAWLDLAVVGPDGCELEQLQLLRWAASWKHLLLALYKHHRKGKIAVCFEQPAANLNAFFAEFAFVESSRTTRRP